MCNTSGPVWEVRSTIGNRMARVLFAVEKAEMVLLHSFIKKTQQTTPADIELALKRALAEQLGDAMHAGKLSKVANTVGKTVEIKLKRQFNPRSQTA